MKHLHVRVAADDVNRTALEDDPDLAPIKHDACCTPETPQGVCCAPKPELPAGAPCCSTRSAA